MTCPVRERKSPPISPRCLTPHQLGVLREEADETDPKGGGKSELYVFGTKQDDSTSSLGFSSLRDCCRQPLLRRGQRIVTVC